MEVDGFGLARRKGKRGLRREDGRTLRGEEADMCAARQGSARTLHLLGLKGKA